MSLIKKIKESYCLYTVKTLLGCNDENLNMILDKVAEKNKFDVFVQGDEDIKRIFEYIYLKRLYTLEKINFYPQLGANVIIKVAIKSIF